MDSSRSGVMPQFTSTWIVRRDSPLSRNAAGSAMAFAALTTAAWIAACFCSSRLRAIGSSSRVTVTGEKRQCHSLSSFSLAVPSPGRKAAKS